MKTAAKILGIIVICVALALVVLRFTGLDPIGSNPGKLNIAGLWLSGKPVVGPVTDWSFASQYQWDKVQTRTWYGIPHSVTTGHLVRNGQLYITSMFPAGLPYPEGKQWTSNVTRDPHVRIKFGDNVYDCVLMPVDDPQERAAILGPRAAQNAQSVSAGANGPMLHLFHAISD